MKNIEKDNEKNSKENNIEKSNEEIKEDVEEEENLKEDNIEEEKIEIKNSAQTKKDDPKIIDYKKDNKDRNIIILVILLLVAILLCYKFYPKLNSYLKNIIKGKPELKYTETYNANDGIYITDVSEVVENVMPSIVSITSKTLISSGTFGPNFFGKDQYAEGAGSGIIISKSNTDIMILTNNHVVSDASELSVQFINKKSYDAKVVGTSEKKDVAIISIPLSNIDSETSESIKIATIGDSKKLKVGNGIIAIGNALGYGQSVTTGVVSALDREISIDGSKNKMIQIDAAINGGNSGGALLNSKGEVVGINSAKYSSSAWSSSASIEGMGFAIPISDVKDLITKLMNGEDDTTATIGIEGYVVNDQMSNYYNMPKGFYVSKIVSGSGASKSNLEIGNIITKINGNTVLELSDIQNVLYKLNKGDKVTLTVSYVSGSEYKSKDIKVTLS